MPRSMPRNPSPTTKSMKPKKLVIAAALLAAQTHAATLTWTGTSNGAWNAGAPANWNGVAPVFDNTADAVFDGTTPIVTYNTWLGDGPRMVRSLTFTDFSTQLEIRINNNSTVARQLQLASDTGTATITMDSSVTAPVIIGALAGNNPPADNGTIRLDNDLDIVQNSASLLTMRRPIQESGGARGITKSGTGKLALSAANTFTGDVTINEGTLQTSNNAALGTGTKSVTIASGATLELNANINLNVGSPFTVSGTGVAGAGAIHCLAGSQVSALTAPNGLTLAGDTTVNGLAGTCYGTGTDITVGNTTGLFTLTKIGAGQFDIRGTVTIGNLVVSEGAFQTQSSLWNDDGYTASFAPGTEFKLYELVNAFPRDISLDNATISSTGSQGATAADPNVLSGDLSLTGASTLNGTGGNLGLLVSGNVSETAPGASLTIGGTRRVILSGTNTYTGATTVGNGANTVTFEAGGSFTSDISVATGATIAGEGVTTGTLTLADASLLEFDRSTTGANEYLRAADVIIGGLDVITLVPTGAPPPSDSIILHDDNGGLSLSNFDLPDPGRATLALSGAGDTDLVYQPNSANLEWRAFSDSVWAAEDAMQNFQNLGTSSPDDFFSNDNVDFVDSATGTVDVFTAISAGNIVFKNTSGNDVDIAGAAGSLTAGSISTTSSGDVSIEPVIQGTTPVTVGGTGTLTLLSDNTSTGAVTINSGTLQIGDGGSTGNVAGDIANDASLVIDRGTNVILNGVISGSGTLTKEGAGIAYLKGENTYTGLTTVNAGSVEVGYQNAGSIVGNVLVNSGAFLNFGGDTNNRTHDGNITGAGKVAKWGTSVVTLTSANTFSGGLNIHNGTIIAAGANLGGGPVEMIGNGSASTLQMAGDVGNDIVFANGSTNNKLINLATGVTDATLSGTIHLDADSTTAGFSRISPSAGGTIVISGKMTGAGTGGYAKRNSGTVVITGTTNDYTGPTNVVDNGTLLVDGNVPGNVLFGQNLDGSSSNGRNGTLGGSGTIGGDVTAQNVSNLAPGGSSAAGVTTPTAAVLTINGNLDISALSGGAGLVWMDLDAPAGTNDRLAVGGTATIGTLALDDFAFNNLGGLAAGSYTLISSGGIVGAVDGTPGTIAPGFDGALSISGNDVVLTVSASGGAFDTWVSSFGLAGPEAAFDFDKDLDGFDNGLEWILGGNPTIADGASIAPTVTGSAASGVTLEFKREEDSIGVAELVVEYGTTLASWPGSATVGASTTPADGNGVTVTVNDVPDPDEVTVNIPAVNAGGSGKLFARLKAVLLP